MFKFSLPVIPSSIIKKNVDPVYEKFGQKILPRLTHGLQRNTYQPNLATTPLSTFCTNTE